MNKKVSASLLAFALLCACFSIDANAQKAKVKNRVIETTKTVIADPTLAALPASDMIVTLDVKRLLTDLVPKILSESPEKLAQFNAQLEKIKSQSSFDLKQIDRITVGLNFIGAEKNKLNVEAVALARTSYNSSMLLAGGKIISKGKFREEKHGNKTITLFDIKSLKAKASEAAVAQKTEQQPADTAQATQQTDKDSFIDKIIGSVMNPNTDEIAVAALDDKTLAIGKLSSVKAAVDSSAASKAKNAAVVALASQTPGAIISFGGNVPANLSGIVEVDGEFSKDIDSIRQLYGSLGMSASNYEMNVSARTLQADQAKKLNDVVQFFKQIGGSFLQNRNDDMSKVGGSLLQNLQVKHEGKDLHLKVEMKQAEITGLLKLF